MKTLPISLALLCISVLGFAQKEITSTFLLDKIKIDGELNELIWQSNLADVTFIQSSPNNGVEASQKTRIAVLNDASYIYISAELYINNKQHIHKKLSSRDNTGSSDYFGLIIDPFGASREGWAFLVTAANVQLDIKVTNNGNYVEWNAVWESAVKIYENKWTVELKIPFNSLRFSKGNLKNCTINFERFDANTNENSFWNPIDEDKNGTLNQFGKLNGLTKVDPPINLSLSPFASIIQENGENGNSKTTFSGGLDVKYVYKNAYTLDVSLIPDFSQAPSDDEILNLSPFAIKYNENRQFFVEGTELFDKGNYLYTRRIGGEPIHKNNIEIEEDENITENPVTSNILNLLKFTGKSKNGFSFGVLNGITNKSEASVYNTETNTNRKVITNPLTNYNAIVIDKTLINNSSVTLINNSVFRSGVDYDSNLTAGLAQFYDKSRKYSFSLNTAFSQKYYSESIEKDDDFGFKYKASLKKISGKYKGGLLFTLLDDSFANNDFGFHQRNNYINYGTYVVYAETKPKKLFSYYHFIGLVFQKDNYTKKMSESSSYELQFYGKRKNNHNIYTEISFANNRNNFFEARVKNRVNKQPNKLNVFLEYHTNQNKNASFKGFVRGTKYLDSKIYTNSIKMGYGIKYRLGSHFSLKWEQDYYNIPNSIGYFKQEENDIIFGQRKIKSLDNSIHFNYAVNSKIYISSNVRHYWIQVAYKNHYTLLENGSLGNSNYDIDVATKNTNFNTFNVDFLAKWQFAPASEVSLTYKLNNNYSNKNIETKYSENINNTLNENSNTTIAFKLTYLIDFN